VAQHLAQSTLIEQLEALAAGLAVQFVRITLILEP
jgi:hypothetical protein